MTTISSFREFIVTLEQGVCTDDASMQNIRIKVWLDPNKKQASYSSAIGLFKNNANKQYYLASEEWDEKKIDPDRERNENTFFIDYKYPKDMDLKSIEKDLRLTHGIEKVKTDLYRVGDKWVENTIKSLQLQNLTDDEEKEIITRRSATLSAKDQERKKKYRQENNQNQNKSEEDCHDKKLQYKNKGAGKKPNFDKSKQRTKQKF